MCEYSSSFNDIIVDINTNLFQNSFSGSPRLETIHRSFPVILKVGSIKTYSVAITVKHWLQSWTEREKSLRKKNFKAGVAFPASVFFFSQQFLIIISRLWGEYCAELLQPLKRGGLIKSALELPPILLIVSFRGSPLLLHLKGTWAVVLKPQCLVQSITRLPFPCCVFVFARQSVIAKDFRRFPICSPFKPRYVEK